MDAYYVYNCYHVLSGRYQYRTRQIAVLRNQMLPYNMRILELYCRELHPTFIEPTNFQGSAPETNNFHTTQCSITGNLQIWDIFYLLPRSKCTLHSGHKSTTVVGIINYDNSCSPARYFPGTYLCGFSNWRLPKVQRLNGKL